MPNHGRGVSRRPRFPALAMVAIPRFATVASNHGRPALPAAPCAPEPRRPCQSQHHDDHREILSALCAAIRDLIARRAKAALHCSCTVVASLDRRGNFIQTIFDAGSWYQPSGAAAKAAAEDMLAGAPSRVTIAGAAA